MKFFKRASFFTGAVLTFLLWTMSLSAQAQGKRTYFNGKISTQAEDRFDECFEDLTASWLDAYIDSLLTTGQEKQEEVYLCMAHTLQAYQYYISGDSLNFFSLSSQAMKEAKNVGSTRLYYNLKANQIGFYSNHHNTFKAQQIAEQMIEEASKSKDDNAIIMGYLSLAIVHAEHTDYRRSSMCYEQVLKYLDDTGSDDNAMRAQMKYSIGDNDYSMGLYNEAQRHMAEAIELLPTIHEAYLIQALSHFKTGDHATFQKLFADVKKNRAEALQDDDNFIYAEIMDYALNRNYTKAMERCNDLKNRSKALFAKSDVYVLMNDMSKAFETYRLANVALDSIRQETFSEMLASADQEMDTAYQLFQKDEQLRKSRMLMIISALCIVILLLALVSFLFYYRQRNMWQKNRIAIIKKYNAELTEAKEKAEEADRLKTMFLQNMSHDLRTPLNAIVGFSQLLGLPDGFNSEAEKEKYNSYIANNSEMLMLLFEDILNMGDIEKGNFKVEYKTTPCNELCRNILKCVEYRLPTGVELNFTTNVDDSFSLNTDGRRVQQVIMNFLTNACKHTHEGEIRLDCQVNQPENTVTFSVIDTGEGVPEDIRDTLFERYIKRGKEDSHGLGLNICRTIAGKMGGTVSLDKSYTTGAKFDFQLKLQ